MKLAAFFETRKRDNGESFFALIDTAPEWLERAVHDAHLGDLPNDWIYSTCLAACEEIDDGRLTSDDMQASADAHVQIYTHAIYQWLADMGGTTIFSEEPS